MATDATGVSPRRWFTQAASLWLGQPGEGYNFPRYGCDQGNGRGKPAERGRSEPEQGRMQARAHEMELIREAQAGSRAAFDALVRQYEHQVLRLALHLTGSEHDAEDIYQDAFLKAYRYIGNFRFECSFYTWIYRIVTNLCLDQLRRRKTRREDHAVVVDRTGDEIDLLASVSDNRSFSNPGPRAGPQAARRENSGRARQAHAARADGLRAEALPGTAPAHHRRDVEHHGRDRQEYPLPRHQEVARAIGGVEIVISPGNLLRDGMRICRNWKLIVF